MDSNRHITDEQVVERATAAVRLALEKKRITDSPIVVYDRTEKTIYQLKPDGTREVVGTRRTAGRYSERSKKR